MKKSKVDKHTDKLLALLRSLEFACFRAGVEGLPGIEYSVRAMNLHLDLVDAIGKHRSLAIEEEKTCILTAIKTL